MANERRQFFRRGSDRDSLFDKDELAVLMSESYRTHIEYSVTLLERQDVLNQSIEKMVAELARICTKQAEIAAALAKVPSDLTVLAETHRTAEVKEHTGLTLRIYAAFGLLGTLILTLLTLLVQVWPKTPAPFPGP
jgi:hypothetical protein